MHHLRLRDEGGFSLIEMIMVLAILGTVLGGVTTVFISGSRAELQINNRFQAQEASRLAMAAIRRDLHGACTSTLTGTSTMTLSTPIMDTSTTPATAPVATTQCGMAIVAATKNISKIIWCVLPMTAAGKYALYRQKVDLVTTTCTASSKLVADNLVTPTTSPGYFSTQLMTTPAASVGSIAYGETQTVDVDIPVSFKQGTAGALFDLKERVALPNVVWSKSTIAQGLAAPPRFRASAGPCTCKVPVSLTVACFPPKIF